MIKICPICKEADDYRSPDIFDAHMIRCGIASCAGKELESRMIRDRDGKKVSQSAFNVLEYRYYEYEERMVKAEAELASLRAENERLRNALEWACGIEVLQDYEIRYKWSIVDELRRLMS